MTKSLHDEFTSKEHGPEENYLLQSCKSLLYATVTGQRLVDVLNFHRIPVKVETSDTPGYRVINHASIILTCPSTDIPLYEMAIHLAYDMNYPSKNPEVEKFLAKNNFERIYEAYESKTPYSHIETLMLQTFNTKS